MIWRKADSCRLWVMCNDLGESGQLSSLMSLKAIDPVDSTMEVVLVDRRGDSRLRELEDKAQEIFFAAENDFVLAGELGKLVALHMGGSYPVENGDINMRWGFVSNILKDFQRSIVLERSIVLCWQFYGILEVL